MPNIEIRPTPKSAPASDEWAVAEPVAPAADEWEVAADNAAAYTNPYQREIFNVFSKINEGYIAPSVGLPVDAMSAVLRKVGVPVPPDPVGGSESIKKVFRSVGSSREGAEPETATGKIAAAAGGSAVTAVAGGGLMGAGAKAAGAALGSRALTETGKVLAAPGANLTSGAGGGALGSVGEETFKGSILETPAKIGGEIIGGVVGGGVTRLRPSSSSAPDPVLAAYERLGLAPSAAEAGVGGRAVQWLEGNILPQTFGGGGVMERFKQQRLKELTDIQGRVATAFGAPAARETAGNRLKSSVMDNWVNAKNAAGAEIERIRAKYPGDELIYAPEFVNAVSNPIGAGTTSAVRKATLDPLVVQAQQLIRNNGGHFTVDDLVALKGAYGRAMEPGLQKNVNDAQVDQLFAAVRNDFLGHIKTKSLDDFTALKKANADYSAAQTEFARDFKKLLGTKEVPISAERAYDIVTGAASEGGRANLGEFRAVWNALPADERGNLAATIVSRLGSADKSKPMTPENFSLAKFVTEYRGLSQDAKGLLFNSTPASRVIGRELDDLSIVSQNIQEKLTKLASTSKSGTGAIAMGQFGLGALSGGLDGFALTIGGPWVMANVLTNPKAVKGLTTSLRGLDASLDGMMRSAVSLESARAAISAAGSGSPPQQEK